MEAGKRSAVMTMSETNGDGRFNVVQKAQILAMLSVCEDPEQASEHLSVQGVEVSPQKLARVKRHNAHHIQHIKDSGIARELVGQAARHLSRVKRMDQFSEWIEQQMMGPDGPSQLLDRERAAVIHRYRELMALLIDSDSPGGRSDAEEQVSEEDQQRVGAGLSLLELMSDGREPDEVFAQLVFDATRRVAAASGATFRAPEPALPPLE